MALFQSDPDKFLPVELRLLFGESLVGLPAARVIDVGNFPN